MFSSDVQSILTTLMGAGEKEGDVIKKALRMSESFTILKSAQGEKESKFTLSELSKSLTIITKMSEAGYTHDKTITICKAIFVDMSDANLDAAFEMFDMDKGGTIDAAEMKKALPLMGEDVPEEKLGELFKATDQDKDGKVDKAEFRRLVRGLNSEDGAFASFRKSWDSSWKSVGQKLGGLFASKKPVADEKPKDGEEAAAEKPKEDGPPQKSMGERMKESLTTTPEWAKQMQENTNAYVLANKAGISWTLGPAEQTKIGKVITRMTEAEYSEESSIAVVKALFTDCSEEELRAAFAVFSTDGKDSMSKESFTKAMPIMGEDVPADKVEEAFKLVDSDGSGELDLSEFTSLIEMVNPRKTKKPAEVPTEQAGAEAPTEQAKESASATIANKWTDFTSRFTAKKEEAPAEAPAAEAPETKAEPAEPPASGKAPPVNGKAEPAEAPAKGKEPPVNGKAAEPSGAEPEKTPAAVVAS